MTEDAKFSLNLLRLLTAETGLAVAMQASRDLYGKSLFALGLPERAALEQLVFQEISQIYTRLPNNLKDETIGAPIGFQAPPKATGG